MKSLILPVALLFAVLLAIPFLILNAPHRPEGVIYTSKPDIYITRTDRYRTIEGRELWVLEYTINGELQAPAFNSREAMAEYRDFLATIGKLYEGE
jgi:hypothetical protein